MQQKPIDVIDKRPQYDADATGTTEELGRPETTDQSRTRTFLEEIERRKALETKVRDRALELIGATNFQPMGARVLVLPLPPAETFDEAGALVKPDIAKERPAEGIVLELGTYTDQSAPMDTVDAHTWLLGTIARQLAPGAHVCYGKFSGTEIVVDETEMVLLQLDEVLGVRGEKGPSDLPTQARESGAVNHPGTGAGAPG